MKDMFKLGVTLMIVTLIASLALALTNHYTFEKIEMQKELVIKESLNKVVSADSFKETDSYFDAYDKDGKLIGRALKVEVPGYSSVIDALVGIDLENKITRVDIISHQETPGLGADIGMEWFLKQFVGKTKDELKIKKDGGEIDGVTGATISSRAITEGVRKFMEECPCEWDGMAAPQTNYTEGNVSEENATG